MTASVYSSALNGLFRWISQVSSSTATALSTMVRSHSLASLLATPLMVYATSWAVTGLPLVNLASVRMVNVQVRPSSLHE